MRPLAADAPLLPRGDERVLVYCGDPGIPAMGPSGCSAHLRGIVRALAERGHEVRLAVHREADARGAVDEALDVPILTLPPRRWGWLPRAIRDRGETWDNRKLLRRALRRWRPALIWERSSLLSDAGARLPIPRLLEVNAPLCIERTGVYRPAAARQIEARSLRTADRVITVSSWLSEWAVQSGCEPSRVRRVPNATSLPPGDRARGRRTHGLDGWILGFVGSMKPWHGVDRIRRLLDAMPQATALLIGDGPEHFAHPRARHLPQLSGQALADAIAAMDVGLAPYPKSAPPWFCPLKILDYRAQGVWVVATASGDIPQLVGDGGTCLPPDAPNSAWIRAISPDQAPRPPRHIRRWDQVLTEALQATPPRALGSAR